MVQLERAIEESMKKGRVMSAMLQMTKINIAELEQAYEGGTVEAPSRR
jgi:hypothetical protein